MIYYSIFLSLFLSLVMTGISSGQTSNFEDGFEDGNFNESPTWSGDDSLFSIAADQENNLLQLSGNDEASTASLSTYSDKISGYWEFYFKYNASTPPSGSNQAAIFLMSDRTNLQGAVNGYAVQVGRTGEDVFEVVRYDAGQVAATILSDTTVIKNNETGYRVRVSHSTSGEWQIEVGKGYSGMLYKAPVSAVDSNHTSASRFGVLVNYTSTRADNFFFDFKIDLPPFAITEITPSGENSVTIAFNRAYDPSTISISDFSLSSGPESSSLDFISENQIQITFSKKLPSDKYLLEIGEIRDQSGNLLQSNTANFIVFGNYTAGDVKINEFMYDPPEELTEYIEIINTSSSYLNLSDWKIGDNSNIASFKLDPVVLPPDSFLVISQDTLALSNIFGNRAYLQNDLPSFNNSGDMIRILTDSDAIVDSLSYNPDWGGSNIALERRSTSASASYKENWGDSPHPKGGTPGVSNLIPTDSIPPSLTGLATISDLKLQLNFNERLETGSVLETSNYNISNSTVQSVNFIDPSSIELSLTTPLQNAQNYTVSVSGVKDIFSNSVALIDTSFTFYKISPVGSDDIFINEFSYDPAPGITEYIEIYNPTSKSFDLQGWTLNDNRGNPAVITDEQFMIPPESFVIVAPDNTLLDYYPDILLISMPDFPSLNNGGDDIILRGADDSLLDSLQYASSWGGNEKALERRTTTAPTVFSENWGDSPYGFGTPGSANEIAADQQAPTLTELTAIDPSILQLVFSERITSSTATDLSNYSITPSRHIQLISTYADTVTLYLSNDLISDKTYEVTVSNIEDIFGNMLTEATRQVEFLKTGKAKRGDIVINEFLADPTSNGSAEFIELYNTTDINFNLSEWCIGDASGKSSIDENILLKANSYLILTESSIFARNKDNAVALTDFPALNNGEEIIYLQNSYGITIDSLHYSSIWGETTGKSLERKDPFAASNDASNWQINPSGNSAGNENFNYQPDVNPPHAIFSKLLSEGQIEVRFNEFIQLTDDTRFLASGQPLSVTSFDSTHANTVLLEALPAKTGAPLTHITVQDLTDIRGNRTSTSEIAIAQPLNASDLVVNEIMYNPRDDSDDNRADQSEYIELRNTRNYAVSLEGLVLHDAPDEDGNTRTLTPVSTTAKWVPPQGVVLIYAGQAPAFEVSKIAYYFDLKASEKSSVVRIDRSSLSLSSSGDAIFISDSTGTTIDSVFYDESWQNPNIIDTRGIALERITPKGNSNDKSNWGSSVNPKGGTPNTENSIYQEIQKSVTKVGISFTPNPFSPDGDGYEDNLFINYKLDQPDYLLKVQIYDRYGRFITELADGKQAGFEGTLIWDGRKNDDSRNRIGIYIVVFEAYNSATGENKAFKETVVLARHLN